MESTSSTTAAVSEEDALQFHLGFQRVEADIRAVAEDDLEPINLDVPGTVATVLGAVTEILALRPILAGLATFDISQLDKLRDYTLGLAHTHSEFRAAAGPANDLDERAEEMTETREIFYADATALVRRKLLDPARVAKLRGGYSHRMIAFDVIGLASLFLERWADIQGRTGLRQQEIEQARLRANQLVAALGQREQAPVATSAASLLRQKAYTLLFRSYQDVRAAVQFIRRRQGDADSITPSLFAGRGKRPPEESTAPVTPPLAVADDAASAPAPAIAPTPAQAVGMPGARPFTDN